MVKVGDRTLESYRAGAPNNAHQDSDHGKWRYAGNSARQRGAHLTDDGMRKYSARAHEYDIDMVHWKRKLICKV